MLLFPVPTELAPNGLQFVVFLWDRTPDFNSSFRHTG